jgi:putative ABC transport system permease protein
MMFRRILLKLWRRRRLERDIESEIALHRDLARQAGNPIGLGNVTRIQEEARDLWRFTLVEDFWRDVFFAIRSLRRAPGFAVIATLTLALGIGANTAMFTLLHRIMLSPLPVREPDRLIELLVNRGGGPPGGSLSYVALQQFRTHSKVCSNIIGFSNSLFHTLIEGNVMERVEGQFVTGDYFPALGVSALRGRPIMPEDDRIESANNVAVISHSLWQQRFGGLPDAIGKKLVVENVPFTIIGVTPPDFHGLEVGRRVDIWLPLETERTIRRPSYTSSSGYKWIQLVGRLHPGKTVEDAQAELRVLFTKDVLEAEIAELLKNPQFEAASAGRIRTWSLSIERAGTGLSRARQQYSTPLFVLMAIVGVLLLIACTNVANLLFARALAREREIVLRLSLGAGRLRLIRQLLTESAVLVAVGGTLSVFIAYSLSRYLAAFLANTNAPLVLDVSPNLATLAFTAAVSVFTVVLFGLMPACRSTDLNFAASIKGGGGGHSLRGSRRSAALIVVQVAMLMVLVFGAGLFLRTLHNLNSIDLGFDRSNLILMVVDPFGSGHSPERLKTLSTEMLERLEGLPGIKTASLVRFAPITGGSGINISFGINRERADPMIARSVWVNHVGTKYFKTLSTPVIAGREFGPEDSNSTHRVVVVNQAFARRYFGQTAPVGKTILQNRVPMEIIGVVGDAKYADIRENMQPTVYYDVFQEFGTPMQFVIRTERAPKTAAAAIRAEIRSVFGPVSTRERTLEDQIDASISRERLVTSLSAVFGGLALMLAIIGLYGVVSNTVARRTRDIGIRIALGFDQRSAIFMVLREVFVLVGGGIILGLPLAVLITRSISGQFFGLAPDDPFTVLASVGVLMLSGLAAGFVPARRAARVDPVVALRVE